MSPRAAASTGLRGTIATNVSTPKLVVWAAPTFSAASGA